MDLKFCPYCGKELSEYDKEHWAEHKNIDFENIKQELEISTSDELPILYCTYCGAKLKEMPGVKFCAHCGANDFESTLLEFEEYISVQNSIGYCPNCGVRLESPEQELCSKCAAAASSTANSQNGQAPIQNSINTTPVNPTPINTNMPISSAVIKHYVVVNPDRYIKKFKDFEAGHKISFNFAALLVTPLWLIYRRLYVHLLIFCVISAFTGGGLSLILYIFYGLLGDYMYYSKFKKEYAKGPNEMMSKKYGVNNLAIALALIAIALMVIAVMAS